jgi:predicted dehydrogenase
MSKFKNLIPKESKCYRLLFRSNIVKIGILGAGNIANKMAQTCNMMKAVEVYAIGSREYSKAKDFAYRHGIKKAYGSYDELLTDPNIDLVYIATPISHHYDHMKRCLIHGKHILCEKAFTVDAVQAKEVLDMGKQKKLLVAEGIWTRYLPIRKILQDVLIKGEIGDVSSLTADICHTNYIRDRLIQPELAGGVLLDMGVYVINFALMIFGDEIERIDSTMIPYTTKVDAMENITLSYKNGKMASLHASMISLGNKTARIFGDKGHIEYPNLVNCPGFTVFIDNKAVRFYKAPKQLTGFEYQILSCKKAIEKGHVECEEMPHLEILKVMNIMDRIRKIWTSQQPPLR